MYTGNSKHKQIIKYTMVETDLKILEEELAKIHPAELARGRKALVRRRRKGIAAQSVTKPKQSLELICIGPPKNGNIKPLMNDALAAKMRTMSREQVRYLLTKSLAF